MKFVNGNKYIGELFIPGTHDSGAEDMSLVSSVAKNFTKTQNTSIKEQLELGVRFFDIRIHTDKFKIYHGSQDLNLTFKEVMEDFITYIERFPSETLLVQIKHEGGSMNTSDMYDVIYKDYIAKYKYIKNLHITNTIDYRPQLKDLRGKIFFIKRGGDSTYGVNISYSDNTIFSTKYFYIQDAYDPAGDCTNYIPFTSTCIAWNRVGPKKEKINEMIDVRINNPNTNTIYLNFISLAAPQSAQASFEYPETYVDELNDYAIEKAKLLKNKNANGNVFIFDFINTSTAKAIIDLNF